MDASCLEQVDFECGLLKEAFLAVPGGFGDDLMDVGMAFGSWHPRAILGWCYPDRRGDHRLPKESAAAI